LNGRVEAVCTSAKKGVVKTSVASIELRSGHGVVGDAHAGPWHRQVSLLAAESIARMREVLPDLADGAFAENVVTSGVALRDVAVGSRIELGDALLEVTQIGKECHTGCAIGQATGQCIMPTEGVFCRVLTGGTVGPGDAVRVVAKADER
jgi:MOSC domain-containing protein YiiM